MNQQLQMGFTRTFMTALGLLFMLSIPKSAQPQSIAPLTIDSLAILSIRKEMKILSIQDNPSQTKTLGFIARGMFDSHFLDTFLSGVHPQIRVKTESKTLKLSAWRKSFYDRDVSGEINWGFFRDEEGRYLERLEIWEGGEVQRIILILRRRENDTVLAISDYLI